MKKLQMVDLQTQYEFIKDQVDSTVLDIFKRGTFINGPTVKEFQSDLEKYLNEKHGIDNYHKQWEFLNFYYP